MVKKDSGWGLEGSHLIAVLWMKFSRTPWGQQVREAGGGAQVGRCELC